jgi:hypothetical protein
MISILLLISTITLIIYIIIFERIKLMTLSRKQALDELQNMFPDYERNALDTLLRANGINNLYMTPI